jgi:hypothetical protein
VTGGLLVGGLLAAPLGGYIAKRVPPKTLLTDGGYGADGDQPVQPV